MQNLRIFNTYVDAAFNETDVDTANQIPRHKCEKGEKDDPGDEVAGDLVSQLLYWSLERETRRLQLVNK